MTHVHAVGNEEPRPLNSDSYLGSQSSLLKRGHDVTMTRGQTITAYVDSDDEIALPIPPAPEAD